MAKKKIKVLFFIAGFIATKDEDAEMNKFSAKHLVCVRNAAMIREDDGIEDFDVVAGEVPDKYAEAAKLKPKAVKEPTPPKVDAKTVAKESPAAPPVAPPASPPADPKLPETPPAAELKPDDAAPPGSPPSASEAVVAEAAKPVTPEPKPGAGKGWKPNA
jgi:hypothetical protein